VHLLIDALSVNNLSGRHVLLGHLEQMVGAFSGRHLLSVVTSVGNRDLAAALPLGVQHLPSSASPDWIGRVQWGALCARRFALTHSVDAVFSPSGMLGPGWRVPQIVLAQNPWPLVPGLARGLGRVKSFLQRRAFSIAQRKAARMVYNSAFMSDLYEREFGPPKRTAVIAYQGIDDRLFDPVAVRGVPVAQRKPVVLSVSVMARHKTVESLIDAFVPVATEVAGARLVLAGGWPEGAYRREIEQRIGRVGLAGRVSLTGHVDAAELYRLYAEARVFCLLSRCESFGIPAVEAQAFGTPTVVAAGTAAPEVAGPGGFVVSPGDSGAATEAIAQLLQDDDLATNMSERSRQNAQRFRWLRVSIPLIEAISELARDVESR
jgi:glycosyltransferase involved in cell wall biosynthesis